MKTFLAFLAERSGDIFVGYKEPKYDPLQSRGKFHIYNKSSKLVMTRTKGFKHLGKATEELGKRSQKSQEHLEVLYHDLSGNWRRLDDHGIMTQEVVKIHNKQADEK